MKEEIVEKIEKKLGCDISEYETGNLSDYFHEVESYEKLVETCEEFDYSQILKTEEVEIDNFEISMYSADCDERCITAWIITMPNGEVFSYGYSGD
jgi:transcriptional antiterminator